MSFSETAARPGLLHSGLRARRWRTAAPGTSGTHSPRRRPSAPAASPAEVTSLGGAGSRKLSLVPTCLHHVVFFFAQESSKQATGDSSSSSVIKAGFEGSSVGSGAALPSSSAAHGWHSSRACSMALCLHVESCGLHHTNFPTAIDFSCWDQ